MCVILVDEKTVWLEGFWSELFQKSSEQNSLQCYESGILVFEQHCHCRDCGEFISGEYRFAQHRAYEHDDWTLIEKYHAERWKLLEGRK
jgi:hypothetical protein